MVGNIWRDGWNDIVFNISTCKKLQGLKQEIGISLQKGHSDFHSACPLPIIFGKTLLSIGKAIEKGSRSDILVLG